MILVKVFSCFMLLFCILLPLGCSSGGSGSSLDGLDASLASGKISWEDGGVEDLLFARVEGSGISDAVIEDRNGREIAKLDYFSQISTHEAAVRRNEGGFSSGEYTLRYFKGSEEFTRTVNLSWTSAPSFDPAPRTPDWNTESGLLEVDYESILGGSDVRYYIRGFRGTRSDIISFESAKTSSSKIVESIMPRDEYRIILYADVREGNRIVAHSRHVFNSMSLR